MSKKELEYLKKENEALKKQVDKLESKELNDLGGYKWARTLSQDEIDNIIFQKIVEEMMFFNMTSGDSPTKTIEKVIDFVNKGIEVPDMEDDLKELLSLGLITKSVLSLAIAYFVMYLKYQEDMMHKEESEKGQDEDDLDMYYL